jgi:hypothetical protein
VDSADWLSPRAGLTSVKVTEAFAGVDVLNFNALFEVVEGVECAERDNHADGTITGPSFEVDDTLD